MAESPIYSLSEFLSCIKSIVEGSMPHVYLVRAEIVEISVRRHCYLTLIEKSASSATQTASCRANIWEYQYLQISQKFQHQTGQPLSKGMTVVLLVKPQFHPIYGFSLIVEDIDPTYTMGELAKRRQQTIEQLHRDGTYEMNRNIEFPVLPQRIAVVTAATAAGYQDFLNQLHSNERGLKFYTHLFPAIMQGEKSPQSVIEALDRIALYAEHFDVVVITRGGGGEMDLVAFDDYEVASAVSQFPLPIISGIGHTKDVSIVDMVAAVSVKTPTAAAEYLVSAVGEQYDLVCDIAQTIIDNVRYTLDSETTRVNSSSMMLSQAIATRMSHEQSSIASLAASIKGSISSTIGKQEIALEYQKQRIPNAVRARLEREHHQMEKAELRLSAVSPYEVMKRGYSLTLCDGKVADIAKLKPGSKLKTIMIGGTVESTVETLAKE